MKMFRREGEKNRAARGFSICFFFGIAVGTLAGNWLYGREWQRFPLSQWGIWFLGQGPWRLQEGTLEKFFYLLQRRESQGIGAWILGLTLCAAPAYWLLAVWGGLCTGWAITWYTAEKGLMGLPGFFLSCFPQGLSGACLSGGGWDGSESFGSGLFWLQQQCWRWEQQQRLGSILFFSSCFKLLRACIKEILF